MTQNDRSSEAFGPSPDRIRRVDTLLRLGREVNSAGAGTSDRHMPPEDRAGTPRNRSAVHAQNRALVRSG